MKIKADHIAQAVLHQQYVASETSRASQSFLSSRVRHEKCYAQRISFPVMTAGDLDMVGNVSISLEGLVASERDINISSKGNVSAASRAFYQTLDYTEKVRGPFSHATFQRFVSAPQIAPMFFRANRNFILDALGDYYQEGVQSEIIGKKVVNARNIISQSLRAERQEATSGDITNISVGLPSSLTGLSFSGGTISSTSRQIIDMPPLFQSIQSLLNARTAAQRGSALVQAGLTTYSTLKEIADIINSDATAFDSTIEFGARLFGFGDFGVSHTHMHQSITTRYGIPSVDYISEDLEYHATGFAKFVGHQAYAQNITLTGGQTITVLPDVEDTIESVNQRTTSFGYNIVTENARIGSGGMNNTNISTTYHPSSFISTGVNTFQAPDISMTNPLLKAHQNSFVGNTKFVTLYDVNRGYGSSYNVGLSFSGKSGFAPRASFGGGRSHFYKETAPLSGVEGDVDIRSSLINDSVPVRDNITGDYSYFYRAPINDNHGWGVSFSDINLSSSEEFSQSFTRAVKSGLFGYASGSIAQSAGFGDFASSLIGSLASAYASTDSTAQEGFSSLGHVSEINNDRELDIEVVGFNSEQFDRELQHIKQTIFDDAIAEGASPEEATRELEQFTQEVKAEQAKIDATTNQIEETERDLQREVRAEIGEKEVQNLAEGKNISKENREKVIRSISRSLKKLERQKAELNLKSSSQQDNVQKASIQTQNELIGEKIQRYSLLSEFLSRTDHPTLARSNSADNLLQDTYIRQGQREFGTVTSAFSELAHEADSMSQHDFVELQRSRLPVESQNNPEVLAKLSMGYALYKGAAKLGQKISALDDATGNVVSGAMHKLGESFEWIGTHTRRFVRDDLGFSQRTAQNTGDIAQIIAEIFAPGTLAKGVGSVSKIVGASRFRVAIGERLGLYDGDVSSAKIGLKWGDPILGEQGTVWLLKITSLHCQNSTE